MRASVKSVLTGILMVGAALTVSLPMSSHSAVSRLVFCKAAGTEIRLEADAVGRISGISQEGTAMEISESKITPEGQSVATAVSFDPIGAVMVSAKAVDLVAISAGMIDVAIEIMGAPGTAVQSPTVSCTVFQ